MEYDDVDERVLEIGTPAGYGKSTLLSQSFDVLASQEVGSVWLGLDPDDNNPYRFISHLLATLQRCYAWPVAATN